MPPHVTMRDIAARLKVSVATVSLALRNQPDVSAAVRQRVQDAARQLGYQPNPLVSALMRTRRRPEAAATRPALALVDGLALPGGWKKSPSATFRLIRKGALDQAKARGYAVEEFSVAEGGLPTRRLNSILIARGIAGVLLGPQPDGVPAPELDWDKFSAVSIGLPNRAVHFYSVTNDHYFSSMRAMEECLRFGYRRPALLMRTSHRERFQGRWESGFFNAQRMLSGLETTQPLFVENLEDAAKFPEREFRAWLKRERPDVVLSIAPELVEQFLIKLGHHVPQDIGIVGLACPEIGGRISGICTNGELIGATALNLLIARVEANDRNLPPKAIATMVEGDWNPGKTLLQKN